MALPAYCLYSLPLLLPLALLLRYWWRERNRAGELAAIVQNSYDAIIAKNRHGVVTAWNGGAERVFGYRAQDAIGQRLMDLIVPEQYQGEELAILERIGRGEVIASYETVRQRRDGRQIPVAVTISPIYSRAGRIVGAAKTVRDISAQRTAEAQIQRMTRSLEQQVADRTAQIQHIAAQQRAILHHAGYAIIATDSSGLITSFNPAAERMLGYQAADLIGLATPLLFHDGKEVQQQAQALSTLSGQPVAPDFHAVLGKALQGGASERQWQYVRQDGSQLPVLLSCTALQGADGNTEGYLCMAADLSERRRAEVALRDMNTALQARTREAEAANLAKTAFLANMSHEIRTPMNAVLGMLQLLQHAGLDPRQTSYATKADSAARTLLALLNDILDCAQVEAGKLALDPHPFSTAQLLDDVALILATGVGAKPVDLLFDIDPTLPAWVLGDALRLRQVLINLGGNAVKFTERGEVTLACRVLARSAQHLRLEFAVSDTGIGIAANQSSRIFDGFAQAEASTARRYGGSGLGLAISRHLVELMDGELLLDSSVGLGSSFRFSISCAPASPAQESASTPLMPAGHCLLVDDNPHGRQLLTALLEQRGWQVSAAATLADASSALQSDARYDLVMADWMLDGSAGARLGVLLDSCQPRPAIIAMLSLHEQESLRQLPGGAIQVLRPLTPAGLDRALAESRSAGMHTPQPGGGPAPLAGLRLLLVEDNLFNQEVAHELLTGAGAQVDVAGDGRAGIAALNAPQQRYDAVLMDVQMPELDGYEATRLIRQMARFETLPIIAISANAMASDRAAALQAGMNDHIGKPFMLEQVIDAILHHCGLEAPQQLNQDAALARLGGDRAIYHRALRSLPAELQRLQRALRQAVVSGNVLPELHSIKGVAAMAGAEQLQALAAAAERAYRADSAHAHAQAALDQVLLGCQAAATVAEQSLRQLQPLPAEPGVAWRSAMPQLVQLLASANMQALPTFSALRASLTSELPGPCLALEEYIENLQFAPAHALCAQLLTTEKLDVPPRPLVAESQSS